MNLRKILSVLAVAAAGFVLVFVLLFSLSGREETGLVAETAEIDMSELVRVLEEATAQYARIVAPAPQLPLDMGGALYNLPFYPQGKAPAGELDYDPIPFEDLLPGWGSHEVYNIGE